MTPPIEGGGGGLAGGEGGVGGTQHGGSATSIVAATGEVVRLIALTYERIVSVTGEVRT